MKKSYMIVIRSMVVCLFVLSIAAGVHAESKESIPASPPIAQPLVREGAFAVQLVTALGVGTTEDEIEAENRLSELGISPRNGWMADYPVTPDIVGELNSSIGDAADLKKLSMNKDEALKRFHEVNATASLSISPASVARAVEATPPDSGNFADPSLVNDYYYNDGPPVVTYYSPPPAYDYLYAWVPYPFWWTNVWLPGYFILRDFHRPFLINGRPLFVSNHYRDVRMNRFHRVDAVARLRGRTDVGMGMSRTTHSTSIPGSGRTFSGSPYAGNMRVGGMSGPHYRTAVATAPPYRGGLTVRPAYHGTGMVTPSYRNAVAHSPAYRSSGGSISYSHGGGASMSSHGGGGRTGGSSHGGGGGRGSGGRGHR
jgi:hypothetical protein